MSPFILTQRNTPMYYGIMAQTVLKTLRVPRHLASRIALQASREKRDYSAVHLEALERGLKESDGMDMSEALKGLVGRHQGTGRPQKEVMRGYGRAHHR